MADFLTSKSLLYAHNALNRAITSSDLTAALSVNWESLEHAWRLLLRVFLCGWGSLGYVAGIGEGCEVN